MLVLESVWGLEWDFEWESVWGLRWVIVLECG